MSDDDINDKIMSASRALVRWTIIAFCLIAFVVESNRIHRIENGVDAIKKHLKIEEPPK